VRAELPVTAPYHCSMRSLVILVMMVLLPLRMWAGDAMALSMSPAAAASASAAAAPAWTHATAPTPGVPLAAMPCHGDGASAHLSHAGTTASLADPGTAHGEAHASESAHCHALCDVCNGPAMAVPVRLFAPDAESPRLTPPTRERFASQPLRRDVRPPIA